MMVRTCLVLLLLLSTGFLAFGDVIIDCGSSDVYVDDNMVAWVGDESLMGNIGQSQVVQPITKVSRAMITLRVFTSGTKNCYTIKSTKGQRILARASFYYGNYDKKSAPPTFDLLFDGNNWATIQTSLDQVVVTEVSYVVKSAVTNICLAQSEANQFPFISALEVRELGPKMYNLLDSSYALRTKERVAFGATEPIRYSDDVYDRIWSAGGVSSELIVDNDASPLFIDVSGAPDKPPKAVFANAITVPNTSYTMSLASTFPVGEFPVYFNLYITEVTRLTNTQTRYFTVSMNDKLLYSIVPSYRSVTELRFNVTASSTSPIVLKSTLSSNLPPLISAAELFYIIGPLNASTDSNDVDGLQALKTGFVGTLDEWSGDPCLPSRYSWEWITCTTSDPIPRVTELNLGSFGLSGLLPDFSSMDSLEIIDLHDNKISGPIPDFLGAFTNLKVLNLANNSFSGPIPDSISKNAKLKLQVSGNPQLCDTGKSCQPHTDTPVVGSPGNGGGDRKKKSKTPMIIGIAIGVAALFACVIVVTLCVIVKRPAVAGGGDTTDGASVPDDIPNVPARQRIGKAVVNDITVSIEDGHEIVQQKSTTNNQQAAVY